MANSPSAASHLQLIHPEREIDKRPIRVKQFRDLLGIHDTSSHNWVEKLPFAGLDATAGSETDLQVLITLRAYKYILENKLTHLSIPDDPTVESERRQFFSDLPSASRLSMFINAAPIDC